MIMKINHLVNFDLTRLRNAVDTLNLCFVSKAVLHFRCDIILVSERTIFFFRTEESLRDKFIENYITDSLKLAYHFQLHLGASNGFSIITLFFSFLWSKYQV